MGFAYVKNSSPIPIIFSRANLNFAQSSNSGIEPDWGDTFSTLNLSRWNSLPAGTGIISINAGQLSIDGGTTSSFRSILQSIRARDIQSQTIAIDINQQVVSSSGSTRLTLFSANVGTGVNVYAYIDFSNGTTKGEITNAAGSATNATTATNYTKWRIRHTTAGGGTIFVEGWNGSTWITVHSRVIDWVPDSCYIEISFLHSAGTTQLTNLLADNLTFTGDVGGGLITVPDDYTFTKTAGGAAWNAKVVSREYILSALPDQSLRTVVANPSGQLKRVGWVSQDKFGETDEERFGLELTSANNLNVYEDGVQVASSVHAISSLNELRIQIVFESGNYKVKYWWRKNSQSSESLLFTSAKTSSYIQSLFPLHVSCRINAQTGVINRLSIEDDISVGSHLSVITSSGTVVMDNLLLSAFAPQAAKASQIAAPPPLPTITQGQGFPNKII